MSNNLSINLRDAIANHLVARSVSKSIASLLSSKRKAIDYSPYYQRKYVWDDEKATFFIESILLGVEIPPLILFSPFDGKNKLEVVDGRQRFETLQRFYQGDLTLKAKGLMKLRGLADKKFKELLPAMQRAFTTATIRTIEFSTKNTLTDPQQQELLEDKIKKEIFRRYNSGITPLKTLEVQKAQHLSDNFTGIMQEAFTQNQLWLGKFCRMFSIKSVDSTQNAVDSTQNAVDSTADREVIFGKVRELLILEYFPINIYASTGNRQKLVDQLFYLHIEQKAPQNTAESDDGDQEDSSTAEIDDSQRMLFERFVHKVNVLYRLYEVAEPNHWRVYQALYWALVILEINNIDIEQFFTPSVIEQLVVLVSGHSIAFSGNDSGLTQGTNNRFRLLADFFSKQLQQQQLNAVDFSQHLVNREWSRPEDGGPDEIDEISARLIRPDAETTTVDDLITVMKSTEFLIRPGYQRNEVINIKKSSGIIESMLLGIPLPTIFVYRRMDGICEVVDGQQRLLSILAFIGDAKNDQGDEIAQSQLYLSKKENYKLSNPLKILDVGGKKFPELSKDLQGQIWDFELSIVYIDEANNPNYDPIDLFIRLNSKPYPVKDPSFEMWNSYCEQQIIKRIRQLEESYRSWFYYRKTNLRMENEELLTILAYLAFHASAEGVDAALDLVDIYQSEANPMTFRLQKLKVSTWLEKAEGQQPAALEHLQAILLSIQGVTDFIDKVALLIAQQPGQAIQAQVFDQLLGNKARARNQRHFYVLWFLLAGIETAVITTRTAELAQDVQQFLVTNNSVPREFRAEVKSIFQVAVRAFWSRYKAC